MRDIYLFGALGCGFKTALLVTSIFTYCSEEKEYLIIQKVRSLEEYELI